MAWAWTLAWLRPTPLSISFLALGITFRVTWTEGVKGKGKERPFFSGLNVFLGPRLLQQIGRFLKENNSIWILFHMAGLFLILFFIVLILPLGVALTAFWIWMIVDCVQNESSVGNDKIAWLLLLIFTHGLGATIYFFARKLPRQRLPAQSPPAT